MNYRYTGQTQQIQGLLLKQIKYDNGQLGGWILGDYCLREEAYIGTDVIVTGCVYGQTCVTGKSRIDGIVHGNGRVHNSTVFGEVLGVVEDSIIYKEARIGPEARIEGGAIIHHEVRGNVYIKGCISVGADIINLTNKRKIIIFGNGIIGSDATIFFPEDVSGCRDFIQYRTNSGRLTIPQGRCSVEG